MAVSEHVGEYDLWVEKDVVLRRADDTDQDTDGEFHLLAQQSPAKTNSTSLIFRVQCGNGSEESLVNIPLMNLHSIRADPPSPIWPNGSMTLRMLNQETAGLFYFRGNHCNPPSNKWGGQRLLDALAPYVELVASRQNPGLYLVNPDKELRAVHLNPTFDDDALEARQTAPHPGSFSEWAHLTRISVLAQFSHVTKNARKSRDAIRASPWVRRALPLEPSATSSNAQAGPYMLSSQKQTGAPEEFDAARVYLAKWAHLVASEGQRNQLADELDVESLLGTTPIPSIGEGGQKSSSLPISVGDWNAFLDAGEDAASLARYVFERGCTPDARKTIWPYLLEICSPTTDTQWRESQWNDLISKYKHIFSQWNRLDADLHEDVEASKHRIWIDCLRTDTKHPLFDSQINSDSQKTDEIYWTRTAPQGATTGVVNPHLYRISEILLTFCQFAEQDNKLHRLHGYVQGMSDLCTTCYIACEGDMPKTFWCFVGLMRIMAPNFDHDQTGMRNELMTLQKLLAELCPKLHAYLQAVDGLNLFFCFRWILLGHVGSHA
ncbi:GTPase activating protein [Malassezia psittaci]|uniref:GTPase activating protein n=1 Tax=Malassezia psittaci TaxID=1821823 RepID=A0AAF0F2H5_9BASI|nr:GTPase activating protein [Malassezia psittaci]